MTTKKHNRTRGLVADVIRELMAAPRTRHDLEALCEMNRYSIRRWLIVLTDGGVIWRTGPGKVGKPYRYHLCLKPFEAPPSALEGQACA